MFGNLFGEESRDFPPVNSNYSSVVNSRGVKAPLPPRPKHGYCGLSNQGATCYLNSLLQTLFLTPEFREALFSLKPSELGRVEDKEKGGKVRIIPIQLQKLFAHLLLLNQQYTTTSDLTDSFGWSNSEELQQHDVQELNRILFSAIEDSLIGTSGRDLIKGLYHGSIVNQIICKVCHRVSEREEDFLDLTVAVAGTSGLESALFKNYGAMEMMNGKNQYKCERCRKLVDAERGARIRKLPSILTISLLKFSFDFERMERYKETGKFTFPQDIDMAKYCENEESGDETRYELFSVLIHSGSTHGGHYHAYIRDVNSLGKWTNPDVKEVSLPADKATGKVDFIDFRSPMELLTEILKRSDPRGQAADTLCTEMVKQTGVSWNKRFKKQYGPIKKFLKKYDDIFVYDVATNWVCLRDIIGAGKPVSNGWPEDASTSRPATPNPPSGQCWYDFNDMNIQSIKTKQLSSQYSGKESAYMLFYRRKSMLPKSRIGVDQSESMITDWLREEVQAANSKLFKQREVYEIAVNTVNIRILRSEDYEFVGGALQLRTGKREVVTELIDQREAVSQLIDRIKQIVTDERNNTFHVAKDTISGVHLYQHLTDHDASLKETELGNNSMVFVWDGEQVGGRYIKTGEDNEPLFLSISSGGARQFAEGYPKSLTLGELRLILADRLLININYCELSAIDVASSNDTPRQTNMTRADDGKTLEECKLLNLWEIIVTDSSIQSGFDRVPSLEQMITVAVENHCLRLTSTELITDYPATKIQVSHDANVADLKERALFSLNQSCICRLRIEDDLMGLRPPLHENQSLAKAGITMGTTLVLEPGSPPKDNQMNLTVIPSGGDMKSISLMVDQNSDVRGLLMMTLQDAHIDDTAWHFRKTTWCGEPSTVLDDLDATLIDFNIHNGDILLLVDGRLPPKGYIQLPVLLYPIPTETMYYPVHSDQDGILSWITSGLQDFLIGAGDNVKQDKRDDRFIQLGTVEISREASVDELKTQILKLTELANHDMSPLLPDFIRLRLLENNHLRGVLRSNGQCLQRQKVTSSSQIAVQVLPFAEILSPTYILLNVWVRVPGKRHYKILPELVWDSSQGTSPKHLSDQVAKHCSLAGNQVRLAKYCKEKYDWQIIDVLTILKQTCNHSNNIKGKRAKKLPKINVKQNPYYVRDGDIIGVKDLMAENGSNTNDFTTIEDDRGRQRLKREAEEKRKRRGEQRNVNNNICQANGDSRPKRQEHGLTIKVDKFR